MQTSSIPKNATDPTTQRHPLYKLHTGYGSLENALNLVGGGVILAMVLMGGVQVLSRLFFNISIRGYIDIVEQMMIGFTFLGLAYCQRTDGHIRMDLVINTTHGRLRWALETITTALGGLAILFISVGAYKHFYRSFSNGDSSSDIGIPLWYAKGFVFIMMLTVVIRLFIQTGAFARLWGTPDAQAIALPQTETDEIADQIDDTITIDNTLDNSTKTKETSP